MRGQKCKVSLSRVNKVSKSRVTLAGSKLGYEKDDAARKGTDQRKTIGWAKVRSNKPSTRNKRTHGPKMGSNHKKKEVVWNRQLGAPKGVA